MYTHAEAIMRTRYVTKKFSRYKKKIVIHVPQCELNTVTL